LAGICSFIPLNIINPLKSLQNVDKNIAGLHLADCEMEAFLICCIKKQGGLFDMYRKILLVLAVCFAFYYTGCSNSSDSSSNNVDEQVQISGKVIDGYVSNAEVKVYSDSSFENIIGSGVTDTDGDFSINVNSVDMPSKIYLKSFGGIDNDTGLVAPTMVFIGESNDNNSYNISPLTNEIFKEFAFKDTGLDITQAAENFANLIGMGGNVSGLYSDPVSDPELMEKLNKILFSGTLLSSLPPGEYRAIGLGVCDNTTGQAGINIGDTGYSNLWDNLTDLGLIYDNLTVSNQRKLFYQDMPLGLINGGTMMFNSPSVTGVMNLEAFGGGFGLVVNHGSISDDGSNICLAVTSMLPSNFQTSQKLMEKVQPYYSGEKRFIFSDVFGDGNDIGYGSFNISEIYDNGTIIADNMTISLVSGGGVINPTFKRGQIIPAGSGVLSNVAMLEFSESNNVDIYLLQHIGTRAGISIIIDNGTIETVGTAYMSDNESFVNMEAGDYQATFADLDLSNGKIEPYTDNITVYDNGTVKIDSGDTLYLNGDFIGFAYDTGHGIYEMFESGAGQGWEVDNSTGKKYMALTVGYFKKDGENVPDFNGKLNLAVRRILDIKDNGTVSLITTLPFERGSMLIDGNKAYTSITYLDPDTNEERTVTPAFDVDKSYGLYHIYGYDAEDNDNVSIYWPVGGNKALFRVDYDGGVEVGEAYITY